MSTKKAAKKKVTKKVTKKKATKKATKKKKSTRSDPNGRRAEVMGLTEHLLSQVELLARDEAAKYLGTAEHDISNMRNGYALTLPVLLKIVRVGRFEPSCIFDKTPLRKLERRSIRGLTLERITERIHRIAKGRPAGELSEATGLSAGSIYSLRSKLHRGNAGMYTVLGFLRAGEDLNRLLFGK